LLHSGIDAQITPNSLKKDMGYSCTATLDKPVAASFKTKLLQKLQRLTSTNTSCQKLLATQRRAMC